MLVAIERLLLKVRQPASRADEVIALRRRARAELASAADDAERELGRAVQAEKLAVAAALTDVSSCGSCAGGQPWPVGAHTGGACCSGNTAHVFDGPELAALVHAGTRASDLTPPAREHPHAGCAFRGSHGCSLAIEHRPARCVHYVCNTLRRELHAHGRLDDVERRLAALDAAMQALTIAYRARVDREVLAPVIEALLAAAPARTDPKPDPCS